MVNFERGALALQAALTFATRPIDCRFARDHPTWLCGPVSYGLDVGAMPALHFRASGKRAMARRDRVGLDAPLWCILGVARHTLVRLVACILISETLHARTRVGLLCE